MRPRRRYFTPTQWVALVLLAGGAFGALALLLAVFYASDWLPPPVEAVVALAGRITLTPRPPTTTPLPTSTFTATPQPTLSPTQGATATPSRTAAGTATPSATVTISPTPSATPLWATAPPATWAPAATARGRQPPTLADFWAGKAAWQLDSANVGLPIGESDTLIGPDGQLWSYLHASTASRGIHDQWGAEVPFPGCVTLWKSGNRGKDFHLFDPHCLIACLGDPCLDGPDDIDVQQYPRVLLADSGIWVMVYEWRGQDYLRTSTDGLNWARSRHVPDTGVWPLSAKSCLPYQRIGSHPNIAHDAYDCLSGGPPGLFLQGDQMWVFVGMGQNPGHMGCYSGLIVYGVAGLKPCSANPLFTGASSYGQLAVAGALADPFFDFSTISAADVLQVGNRYYMTYEVIRGPGPGDGGDTQFNLGFARSTTDQINGPWGKYPGNPVLGDVPGNVGLGHADMLVLDGVTYLYTATSGSTRGRYVLKWK